MLRAASWHVSRVQSCGYEYVTDQLAAICGVHQYVWYSCAEDKKICVVAHSYYAEGRFCSRMHVGMIGNNL